MPLPPGTDERTRRVFRASELLFRDVREGRPPSVQALQRTGFGDRARTVGPRRSPVSALVGVVLEQHQHAA